MPDRTTSSGTDQTTSTTGSGADQITKTNTSSGTDQMTSSSVEKRPQEQFHLHT